MRKLFCFLILLSSFAALAQRNVKDSVIGTPWVGVHYGANWTAGDLADKYGFMNHVGFMAGYKTDKNWYFGMESQFMFGNKIRLTGLFDHLIDAQNTITDINGDQGKVFVLARGMNVNLTVGKLFPVLAPNKNSGILVQAGAGFLMHHLRIETQDQVIPQIELDYKKGYDRLAMGPNLHQFLGYAFMSNAGYYNFYGGFYAQQGFTKNMRTIFFDRPEEPVSTKTMIDIQYGVRLGWFIPFYKRKPKEFYYN
ncbi:MAG: hypothetical protein V4638_02485 [Bacteroidota bacterium]